MVNALLDADGVIPGAAIIAAGYQGQLAYLSQYEPKGMLPPGFADHEQAGCKDAFVYEDGAQDILSVTAMTQHGAVCFNRLTSFGIPPTLCVVYLAADFDVIGSQFVQAWQGFKAFFAAAQSIRGSYGGDDWNQYLYGQGVKYLISAGGWRDASVTYPRTMQQTDSQVEVGGMTCDVDNILTADYGQWPRPVTPTKENESMDMCFDSQGTLHIAAAAPSGHLLHFRQQDTPGAKWSVDDVTDEILLETGPNVPPYLVQP